MYKNKLKINSAIAVGTLVCIMIAASVLALTVKAGTETIWTDRDAYQPEETVPIYGSGFTPNAYFAIPVIRPDGSIVLGDGTFRAGWDTIQAGADGTFTYNYKLDGISGLYQVRVYNSPWSGSLSETPLAVTQFSDPTSADIDQVRNGAADDPTDPADWVNGNAGEQNSHYVEGYSIPYRIRMEELPTDGTVIEIIIGYDTKHSDRHALDYMTHYDHIDDPNHLAAFGHPQETIDPLINVTGPFTQNDTFPIPTPANLDPHIPNQPADSFNALPASERVMTLFGGDILSMSYVLQEPENTSISETHVKVVFTASDPTAVLAWGGHIASRLDWGFEEDGVTAHSAGGISGSPYHTALVDWNLTNLGQQDRSLSGAAVIEIAAPNITLTKTPSSTKVENGTLVTYTYNATNTGNVDLNATLIDNQFGTIYTNQPIAVNQSIITTVNQVLTANTTNIANVTATSGTGATANATATATVTVLHPALSLTKNVNATKVESGSPVAYTYVVTNTGDTPLTVSLVDDQFGTIFTGKLLAPGASNTTVVDHVLTANTTNVATATGIDQLGTSVQANATRTVTVLHPAITLTKNVNATKVESGSTVAYTYVVTNTGDTSLTVSLTDNQFGVIFTGKVLASGESNTTIVDQVLTANTTNLATAIGVDQTGASVNANATRTVTVLHPDISLTKTPSSTKVENGANVTYTYVVTNTGDTPLTVSLVDNQFGTIFTGKVMAAGASNTTVISAVLIANRTNVATATGVDQLATSVNANATATVTVLHPDISLTKTPSSTKVLGGTNVTYTYNVTNIGDTMLLVSLTDDQYGTLFTGKAMAPGESNITTITRSLNITVTNIANATGVDQLGTTVFETASASVTVIHPSISITKTCEPDDQFAPGNITWTVVVTNTGDVPLTNINITETREGLVNFTGPGPLAPGGTITIIMYEYDLPPGTYYNNASVVAAHQLGTVTAWDDATCVIKPVFILKQFTGVTVLPDGTTAGFNATLVNGTLINVYGPKSGPYIYFNVTYYFENSLNFLGDSFDGQAHNFTLWDKWGGNLMALGSPPVDFDPSKTGSNANRLWLADGSTFRIDPGLTGPDSYRGYIGDGLDISDLASQGEAWITMHLGDQQNGTNPGKGKGSDKDGNSYDTDTVWYIGELGVNQSATLSLIIAPGKNPGGQLQFSSLGCFVINTGPRVRAYGDSYANEDFLYAVERTNTLTVCVYPKIENGGA